MEKEYIKVNKNAYNIFAPQHANRHDKIGKYDLTDDDWTELLKEKLLKKNISNKVLEIGPGTGRILKIFESRLNCRTCAVELSEEMVKYEKIFYPHKEAVEKYEYLFNKVYKKIYPRLKKNYKYLNQYLQENNEGRVE